jgi:hypothetical protein
MKPYNLYVKIWRYGKRVRGILRTLREFKYALLSEDPDEMLIVLGLKQLDSVGEEVGSLDEYLEMYDNDEDRKQGFWCSSPKRRIEA